MRRVDLATREELVARIRLGERIGNFLWSRMKSHVDDRLHAFYVNNVCAHPSDKPFSTAHAAQPPGAVCNDCLSVVVRCGRLVGDVEA